MAKIESRTTFLGKTTTKVTLTGKDKEQAERLERGELRNCPQCSAVLELNVGQCPECSALINTQTGAVAGSRRMDDDALVARIEAQRAEIKKSRSLTTPGIILIVVGAILMLLSMMVLGVIAVVGGFVLVFMGFSASSKAQDAIKRDVGNTLVRSTLEQVFEDVWYSINGHISAKELRDTKLLPFGWDKTEGSDHIKATYKGLKLEMCDLELIEVEETEDADGDTKTEENTVFRGLWLICDFGKTLSADLTLQEKVPTTSRIAKALSKKSDVETDNVDFNNKFTILTDNAHEAFYILTPHMMEFITRADERASGRSYMKFSREGKVHIAIDSGRNAFEVRGGSAATDIEGMRRRFQEEVRYVTDIIDELRLVETLFKQ